MQNFTGQAIPFTLSWNKVTYQNPGQKYDENLVWEGLLNMGMVRLEFYDIVLYNIMYQIILFWIILFYIVCHKS